MPLAKVTERSEGEPIDRLGRIADAMLKAAQQHPEYHEGDDKIIVMLDSNDLAMTAHGGYEAHEGNDAFVNLLGHLDALAQANGIRMDFVPVAKPIGGG